MRILLINQCHYRRGGADIVYLSTIDLLRSYGHEVACFSTLNPENEPTEYEKYFISAPDLRNDSVLKKVKSITPYLYNKQTVKNLTRLVEDFKPDVAQVHLFYATLSVSVLETLKKHKIPIVHTVHDYRMLCPVNTMMDFHKNICEKCATGSPFNCILKKCSDGNIVQSTVLALEAYYWRKVKSPISFIDHFHFVSNFCQNKYQETLPEIKKKSSVQYNFSDVQVISAKDKNIKYYLYYGRLSSQKGVLTLIEAWKELPANTILKIVGTGQQFESVNDYIKNNSLNNVELLGYKSGDELIRLIQNAYFVVVPSEWYENNPMTIIESYHLGVPVIGANIGGIPEIIDEGKTGFIVQSKNQSDLRNTILKANKIETKQYQEISDNCLVFAKTYFSAESNYKYLIKTFDKVIKEKSTNN